MYGTGIREKQYEELKRRKKTNVRKRLRQEKELEIGKETQ
jgi:hypothetical protein